MEQILAFLAEQDITTLIIIGAVVVIFLVVMHIIKKLVIGVITVVVTIVALVGGSYFMFNKAVDNIEVVNNELQVNLPYVEQFNLPLENVTAFEITEPVGDKGYIISVKRKGVSDLVVEVPAAVFAVPGAVDRIETALLEIEELKPYHEQIRQGAVKLRKNSLGSDVKANIGNKIGEELGNTFSGQKK